MKNKKGQVGPKEALLTLIVAGILAAIGVMVFSNVSNTSDAIFDNVPTKTTNESVTIAFDNALDTNSTTLAENGYISNLEVIVNASNQQLVRGTDYSIALLEDTSGKLATVANLTVLNIDAYNNTEIFVSYEHNEKAAGRLTKENLDTTVLDSFELGVIAMLVLGAVVILGALFMLGSK